MKKIFLSGFVLTALLTLSALTLLPEKQLKEDLPALPAYTADLDLLFGECSCQSFFVSCYKNCDGSNCTCSCTLFSCTCTRCSQLEYMETGVEHNQFHDFAEVPRVSISAEQYTNFEQLARLLRESQSEIGNEAYLSIVVMLQDLKEKNYIHYHTQALIFVEQLSQLPESTKAKINTFLDSKGASFRV